MHLVRIPPESATEVWPAVIPHLEKAIARSPSHDARATRARIVRGDAQLWAVLDDVAAQKRVVAALVTAVLDNENGTRDAFVELLGGDNMKAWFALKDQLENWARGEGCGHVAIWARKGWQKHLPDYRTTHYLMRKDIRT